MISPGCTGGIHPAKSADDWAEFCTPATSSTPSAPRRWAGGEPATTAGEKTRESESLGSFTACLEEGKMREVGLVMLSHSQLVQLFHRGDL